MQPKHPSQSRATRGVPVEQSRPIQTKQAIRAFQAGKSFNEIAKKTGFSKTTLQRLKADHKDLIESKQTKAVEQMLNVREKALSRMEREIDDIPLASLPVTVGILSDKLRDLTGGNVTTVAHVSVKLPEDVKEATVIDLLPTANPCKQDDDQEETQAGSDLGDGSSNQCPAEGDDHQDDLDGAGGIEPVASGDHGTHSGEEKFLSKWGKEDELEEATMAEVNRRGRTEQDDCHPSRTLVSEETVKLSTEEGGNVSKQNAPAEVERNQI